MDVLRNLQKLLSVCRCVNSQKPTSLNHVVRKLKLLTVLPTITTLVFIRSFALIPKVLKLKNSKIWGL